MIKKYSSLGSNTTLEFNKKSESKITSVIYSKKMKASWFFMVLMVLSLTTAKKPIQNNSSTLVYTSSYSYHSPILKSFVAHGHSGGGGHGYAFFSLTDHDKPIWSMEELPFKTLNKFLQHNNAHTITNIKTLQS